MKLDDETTAALERITELNRQYLAATDDAAREELREQIVPLRRGLNDVFLPLLQTLCEAGLIVVAIPYEGKEIVGIAKFAAKGIGFVCFDDNAPISLNADEVLTECKLS